MPEEGKIITEKFPIEDDTSTEYGKHVLRIGRAGLRRRCYGVHGRWKDNFDSYFEQNCATGPDLPAGE